MLNMWKQKVLYFSNIALFLVKITWAGYPFIIKPSNFTISIYAFQVPELITVQPKLSSTFSKVKIKVKMWDVMSAA